MQRREFITLLSGAAVWPIGAQAQQYGKVPRVGVLWHAGSAEEEGAYFIALQQALNRLGYIDGHTVTMEYRFPNEQPERFTSMAADFDPIRVGGTTGDENNTNCVRPCA